LCVRVEVVRVCLTLGITRSRLFIKRVENLVVAVCA
jgi:hypothetical protein